MNVGQIITWLVYHWEFVGLVVTLGAIAYGAFLDSNEARREERDRAVNTSRPFEPPSIQGPRRTS